MRMGEKMNTVDELHHKLHSLEDELAGAGVVTDEVEIRHLVNRIECARQRVLEIIKYTDTMLKEMRSQSDAKMDNALCEECGRKTSVDRGLCQSCRNAALDFKLKLRSSK